jgi:hypothetical protein
MRFLSLLALMVMASVSWRQWINKHPDASKEEVIEQLNNMKLEFGLTGKGGGD